MELNVHLHAYDGEHLFDPTCHHHIIGSLVYLVVTSSRYLIMHHSLSLSLMEIQLAYSYQFHHTMMLDTCAMPLII